LNIQCPWCGTADPSFHLGINPKTGAYSCWRNRSAHSGYSPFRLLNQLLGAVKASAILRKYGVVQRAAQDVVSVRAEERPSVLHYPIGIAPYQAHLDDIFTRYLVQARGFAQEDLAQVIQRFNLRVGRHGTYAGRWIIPYMVAGRVVYFTARAITSNAVLRYKACPDALAVLNPSTLLFNAEALDNPAGVILCEGALDAIKATIYGPIPAVALGTNNASAAQIQQLTRARRVFIILDNDHIENGPIGSVTNQALAIYANLISHGIPARVVPMPTPYKDLAAIPYSEYPKLLTIKALTNAR